MYNEPVTDSVLKLRYEEHNRALWLSGSLRHLLDDHQLRIYEPYRAWEVGRSQWLRDTPPQQWGIHRCFMVDCGRQVGKTFATNTIRVEDGLNLDFANEMILVGADTEIALKELVIPTINRIIIDAPEEVRPQFFTSRWGMRAGYYFPSTECVIKLVGFENPDSLRGPGLRGANISEAAYVRRLEYSVGSILNPMFSRRPKATLILESSAPEDANHPFDRIFRPDCERRAAYVFMTIDDNTAMSEEQKRAEVEQARAINPVVADREYYGIRGRDATRAIVPEFKKSVHVVDSPLPLRAAAMAAMDPGMRDLFFIAWGYWDAARGKLVVNRDFSARNTSTSAIAEVIRATEAELYGAASRVDEKRVIKDPAAELSRILRVLSGLEKPWQGHGLGLTPPADSLTWWSEQSGEYARNPVVRVSDTDARLIGDLNVDNCITVVPTRKDDKDAALYSLRNAFRDKRIEIHPRCVALIRHLESGVWNEKHTDWLRYHEGTEADLYGHFDGIATLIYMWRMANIIMNINPFPPQHIVDKHDAGAMHYPEDWKADNFGASLEALL